MTDGATASCFIVLDMHIITSHLDVRVPPALLPLLLLIPVTGSTACKQSRPLDLAHAHLVTLLWLLLSGQQSRPWCSGYAEQMQLCAIEERKRTSGRA